MKLTKRSGFVTALAILMILVSLFTLSACDEAGGGAGEGKFGAPQNVAYDGSIITWNAVTGATGYKVSVDGGQELTITSNAYAYAKNGGEFNFSVKAVKTSKSGKETVSDATSIVFKPLAKIEDATVSPEGVISWGVIDSATGYEVRVDGGSIEVVNINTFDRLLDGKHSYQIRPTVNTAGNIYFYSQWSTALSITKLATVDGEQIEYVDGSLRWPTVQGAYGYEITIDGQIVSHENAGTKFIFDAGSQNFEVSIKALGNGSNTISGNPSAVKRFVYLSPVTGIKVVEGIVVWDAVQGADGYKVKVNGNVLQKTFAANEREYKDIHAGSECRISIIPVSNDSVYFSSWSDERSLKILARPILQWNADYNPDGIAMNSCFWDAVDGAAGYMVFVKRPNGDTDTVQCTANERAFIEAFTDVGEYVIEVQALAAAGQDNVYDSQRSKAFNVLRLASPSADGANYISSSVNNLAHGFNARFRSVSGAREYQLYRDGTLIMTQSSPVFNVGNIVGVDVIEERSFNYSVKAIGFTDVTDNRVVLDSLTENSNSFKITVLAAPTNLNMNGYNFTYGEVNGARGYYVSTGTSQNGFANNGTEFDLGGVLNAGGYNVTVCAQGNGSDVLPSNYAPAIRVVRLAAPLKITINFQGQDEGHLNISPVEGATSYMVVFNNDEGNAMSVADLGNVSRRISEQGTTVHATATANEWRNDNVYYMSSKSSATFNFIRLATPTFGTAPFTEDQLIWNAPYNVNTNNFAPNYRVSNSQGVVYNGEKTGTAMQIGYLDGGAEYEFSVVALGDGERYVNSEPSKVVKIYKLKSPVLERVENYYTFDAVARAVSYVIKVDGVIKKTFNHEPDKTYTWIPEGVFTKEGTYSVTVEAIGDGGVTTVNSRPYEIKQKALQLNGPEFTYSYDKPAYAKDGNIVVTITPREFANGYIIYIGGTTHVLKREDAVLNSEGKVEFKMCPNSTGIYNIGVAANGGMFDNEGVYRLTSTTTGGNDRYKIQLLPSTNVGNIIYSQDGVISWDSVNGAVKYKVILVVDGITYEVEAKTASYTIDKELIGKKFSEISTLSVTVISVGNGITVGGNGTVVIVNSDSEARKDWIL